jgi:hypothetical protein
MSLSDIVLEYTKEPYNWNVQTEMQGTLTMRFSSPYEYFEKYLSYYRNLNSIEEIIEEACIGNIVINYLEQEYKVRHPHQNINGANGHGVPIDKSKQVANKIISNNLNEIVNSKTFDEIYEIFSNNRVPGFGALAKYDATLRIASTKGFFPDKIYIHRGAQIGLRALIEKNYVNADFENVDNIAKKNLPSDFSILNPIYIEDFLCIKKFKLQYNLIRK